MSAIPQQTVNPDGLHQRYIVHKADGSPVDPMATYFVLRLDAKGRDWLHVKACRAAARAYANEAQSSGSQHLIKIGEQLRILVDNFDAMDA